ncbi:hypothetical protein Tco_0924208 [Tanacetum coccineum]|uniref:Uncharacterized protein n=1 Tax=Tanacetum coccineum TaxID=301880 RepID=A0ABQ5DA79_9ASTR
MAELEVCSIVLALPTWVDHRDRDLLILGMVNWVRISRKGQNWTKPSTRMERAQKNEFNGVSPLHFAI